MHREIKRDLFESLYLMGHAQSTIASFFGAGEAEIDTFCQNEYGLTFDGLRKEIQYALHPNQDKERPYSVYMHICPNGKKYVGITRCAFSKRWGKGHGYWSNPYFTNAIDRYGWDNIQHAILYMRLNATEAEQKEKELINAFQTTDRRYGYNIEGGGRLNKEVSAETREKLRRNATNVFPTEETRKKMSESHKGEKCHFYGTHLSKKRKDALRILKSKPVEQIGKDGEVVRVYSSMNEAAEAVGVTRQAISSACSGASKECKGYRWRWQNGTTAEADRENRL